MRITLIAALSENFTIGHDNALLWHLPDDLKHFKSLTLGKPIIMGRHTFDSIGKPLPKRQNIVLTKNPDWSAEGVDVVQTRDQALAAAGDAEEVLIIGGGQIYALFLPLAQTLHFTWVGYPGDGETKFPHLDLNAWQAISDEAHPVDERHAYPFRFVTYQRRSG